jgi:hypothetical protein
VPRSLRDGARPCPDDVLLAPRHRPRLDGLGGRATGRARALAPSEIGAPGPLTGARVGDRPHPRARGTVGCGLPHRGRRDGLERSDRPHPRARGSVGCGLPHRGRRDGLERSDRPHPRARGSVGCGLPHRGRRDGLERSDRPHPRARGSVGCGLPHRGAPRRSRTVRPPPPACSRECRVRLAAPGGAETVSNGPTAPTRVLGRVQGRACRTLRSLEDGRHSRGTGRRRSGMERCGRGEVDQGGTTGGGIRS